MLGAAPQVAVLLGSGLDLPGVQAEGRPVGYADVPHWRTGLVAGHSYSLLLGDWRARSLVALRGRSPRV